MPPKKVQMKIEENNVCKFRYILNTFSIDENFNKKKIKKGGCVSSHVSQKIKKNPNHVSWKLKFAIFENFANHGGSIREIHRVSRE